MANVLTDYFRCPGNLADLDIAPANSREAGYFRFGENVLYGRPAVGSPCSNPDGPLYDVSGDITQRGSALQLPFDPSEVVTNFHYERYATCSGTKTKTASLIRKAYYAARPFLPVAVRKHLQKIHLNGWRDLTFPHWPVDTTVDNLMGELMSLAIRQQNGARIPFIWFWPQGKNSCAIVTHDVETQLGVDWSARLMDINESYAMPASFQIVPEERYRVTEDYLESIRKRGFEVNVQDLNHDGHLYRGRELYQQRVARINEYGKRYQAAGFRAGVLYRNQEWYNLLDFEYDTSVPNVAHLDPQRGGCCTVMPYFIGNLVELPVTTTQDYSLFHILNDYSLQLWDQQIKMIQRKNGLINVIIHPDYITKPREEAVYAELLTMLAQVRCNENVWIALPKDVSSWWRQRSQMRLIQKDGEWRVEGPGSERAVLAYASLDRDTLTYTKAPTVAHNTAVCS